MTRPVWLDGHLAPVPDEIDAHELDVDGTLPSALTGRYLRNGPNPLPGENKGHWFVGHGMLHGLRLADGRAEWYRNRWVRTREFTDEAAFIHDDLTLDLTAVPANTNVVRHDGRILAVVEVGYPYEIGPDLETVGVCDFDGRLTTAMTGHPKEDPETGDLLFFGYGFFPPYLTYHRLSGGKLVESREVSVPGPTMMHDFAITENHVVWLDLPVVFDADLAFTSSGLPFRWDGDYGARLGVMRRDGTGDVQWYDIDPCYVLHVGNAYEQDGRIVLDAARFGPDDFASLWSLIGGTTAPTAPSLAPSPGIPVGSHGARLCRWTLDPATGKATEELVDGRRIEFPSHNDTRTGRSHRYLYAVGDASLVKYDLHSGESRSTPARFPGEAVFVPDPDATTEDDGWLLAQVDESEFAVMDAADLSRVATVHLPRRVPAGFHGSWIPDA